MFNKNNKKDVFVRAKDQQIYLLNENIKKYSTVINELLLEVNSDIGPIDLNLTSRELMLLSQYFSERNYEIPIEFTVKKPLNSGDLSELLHNEDYKILKEWPMDDIRDLLKASLYLGIEALNQILLTVISCEFYVEMGENALEEFRNKTGINEEISEEIAEGIKKEFKWAFT